MQKTIRTSQPGVARSGFSQSAQVLPKLKGYVSLRSLASRPPIRNTQSRKKRVLDGNAHWCPPKRQRSHTFPLKEQLIGASFPSPKQKTSECATLVSEQQKTSRTPAATTHREKRNDFKTLQNPQERRRPLPRQWLRPARRLLYRQHPCPQLPAATRLPSCAQNYFHPISRELSSISRPSLGHVDISKNWTKRRLLQAAYGKNPTAIRPVPMHEARDLRWRR